MIALCLGGAKSVWSDFSTARDLTRNANTIVVACNFAGIEYEGRLDVWCSLHYEMFQPWREERARRGYNTDYRAVTHVASNRVPDAEIVPHGWYGSSGLYMAQVALQALGCSGAILCGVPMDEEAGHIHWPGDWKHTHRYRGGVEQAKADGANIRSMSGWTAGVLGRPTPEWISETKGL